MKCPWCGAGLSAKYRVPGAQHPRNGSRAFKRWLSPRARGNCRFSFRTYALLGSI